jgi:hypothetical protein
MGHSAFKHVLGLGLVLVTSMLAASCCAFRSVILPEPLSMVGVQGLQEEGPSVPAGKLYAIMANVLLHFTRLQPEVLLVK